MSTFSKHHKIAGERVGATARIVGSVAAWSPKRQNWARLVNLLPGH